MVPTGEFVLYSWLESSVGYDFEASKCLSRAESICPGARASSSTRPPTGTVWGLQSTRSVSERSPRPPRVDARCVRARAQVLVDLPKWISIGAREGRSHPGSRVEHPVAKVFFVSGCVFLPAFPITGVCSTQARKKAEGSSSCIRPI